MIIFLTRFATGDPWTTYFGGDASRWSVASHLLTIFLLYFIIKYLGGQWMD